MCSGAVGLPGLMMRSGFVVGSVVWPNAMQCPPGPYPMPLAQLLKCVLKSYEVFSVLSAGECMDYIP